MYLSRLYLNTKNRKVMRDVSNMVEMHRTVMSMFPQKEGKDAGATGWIVKPFNPEKLLATVNKVLG